MVWLLSDRPHREWTSTPGSYATQIHGVGSTRVLSYAAQMVAQPSSENIDSIDWLYGVILVQIIDLSFIASFQVSFLFICSPDLFVLSLFLLLMVLPLVTASLPLASAISSAAGFIKLHFPALCLFPRLHVPTGLAVLCLCPCAPCSNMHGLTHSLLVGGGFHLVDLASPSTPRRPIQGPIALHSADQQMLFRWM